jgi:hypothetical protein
MHSYFFVPWLEIVGGETFQEASLWYELSAVWAGFWFAVGEIRRVSDRFVGNLARYEGYSAN